MKLRLLLAAAAASAVAFAAPVSAQEAEKTGFYATLSAGAAFPANTTSSFSLLGSNLTGTYTNSSAFQGDLGLGFDFGLVRTELTYSALTNNISNARFCISSCVDFATDVNQTLHSGFVSAYVDIPTESRFTPYIGGGIGVTDINTAAGTVTIGGTQYAVPAGSSTTFGYQAKLGASYEVNTSTDIFVEGTYKGTQDYYVSYEKFDGFSAFGVNLGARFRF